MTAALDAWPHRRDHAARSFNVPNSQRGAHGAAIDTLARDIDDDRRWRVGGAAMAEIFNGVHMSDGGEVLVRVGPPILGSVTFPADRAANEQLTHAITVSMWGYHQRIGKHAHLNAIDPDRVRADGSRLETDIPKVQGINGSLEGLDGLYGPAGVFPNQRAVRGVIPALFEVGDGGSGQPVGVLRRDQTGGYSASGMLVLNNQRASVAGIFSVSQDTELRQLRCCGQVIGQLRCGKPGFRPKASGRTCHG